MEKWFLLLLWVLTPLAKADSGKPRIQFTFSYSGPLRGPVSPSASEVRPLPHRSADLGILYQLMAQPQETRGQSLSALCNTLSFDRKLELGTSLGFLLSGIYDESRIGNGPNSDAKVTIEQQWDALRRRFLENDPSAKSGVCRDSASTLAAFFHDCGIPDSAITIDSYISVSGGHQIVSVRSPEGKLYTVNWSELSVQEPEKNPNPQMARPHMLYDQGIQQLRYNWRGEVIGRRDTSLGILLKQATHGPLDDPLYNPTLMSLEAQATHLRVTAFRGTLSDAHLVQGFTGAYQKNIGKFVSIEAAAAQANRSGPDGFRSNITYGRFLFFARPTLELDGGLSILPLIQFEGAGALLRYPGEDLAPDGNLRFTPGIGVSKQVTPHTRVYAEASQGIGMDPYNNNQADRLRPTPFRERFLLTGGVVLAQNWDLSLQRRSDIWNQSTTVLIQKGDRSQKWSFQGALSIYEIPGQQKLALITSGISHRLERPRSNIQIRTQYQQAIGASPQISITLLRTQKN